MGANCFLLAEKCGRTYRRNHSWSVRYFCHDLAESRLATLQGGASRPCGAAPDPKIVAGGDGDICRARQFQRGAPAGRDANTLGVAESVVLLAETATP
jgi:hypothetical protein